MAIVYDKLFDVLSEYNMKKGDLQKEANITASIMSRLAKNETVRTDTINKICKALQCQPGDIMEYMDVEIIEDEDKESRGTVLITIPRFTRAEYEEPKEIMTVERARRLGLL